MTTATLPVVLITGAPGSGKTTALNRLLAELGSAAPPPAVITHRLAREYGLDLHPVGCPQGEARALRGEMFDFGSGCVCCSPTGDLLQHLLALRRELAECAARGEVGPAHVLIETTGLADPAVFVRLLTGSPELAGTFRLAAVLAIVEVRAVHALLPRASGGGPPDAVCRRVGEQLRAADAVLLSRAPSAGAAKRARELVARALHPRAAPLMLGEAELCWAALLGLRVAAPNSESGQREPPCALPAFGPISAGGLSGSGHEGGFDVACLVEEGTLRPERLQGWGQELLRLGQARGGCLLRVKGLLSLDAREDGGRELLTAEWSAGCAHGLELAHLPPELLREPGRAAGRPLAHAMAAGLELAAGSCKLLLVGVALPVNELRAALWRAMVPPGFGHAAEIELDFPQASGHARAQGADPRALPGGDGGERVPWAAMRLVGWLGAGRDALLFCADGAFCALADFGATEQRAGAAGGGGPPCGGWDLATGAVARQALPGGGARFVAMPAQPSEQSGWAVDLASGRRVAVRSGGAAPAPVEGEAVDEGEGAVACRRLELAIVGGSIYVAQPCADCSSAHHIVV